MEPTLGEILMFGGNFAPRNWALCDGSILAIAQYQALFSILGTTYGGDGRTTFALPDLRGRLPMHKGNGPGLSNYSLGQKGGTETNTLTVNQLPPHNHSASASFNVHNGEGDETTPGDGSLAIAPDTAQIYSADGPTPNAFLNDNTLEVNINNTGNNTPVNNVQPFQALNFIICISGLFPSRN